MASVKLIPLNNKVFAWCFILVLLAILSYVGMLALRENYNEGIMTRPYFWIGSVFWDFFGFFYYELTIFVRKRKSRELGIFIVFLGYFLYHFAVNTKKGLFEFLIPVGFSPIIAILRGVFFEKPLKKYS